MHNINTLLDKEYKMTGLIQHLNVILENLNVDYRSIGEARCSESLSDIRDHLQNIVTYNHELVENILNSPDMEAVKV